MTPPVIILSLRLPPGAGRDDVRNAAEGVLAPTLAMLDAVETARLGLVCAGEALRSLDSEASELLDVLRARVQEGRIEVIASALYEPLLGDIPEEDAVAQVQSHLALVRQRLDVRPRGLALPWMVWSNSTPRIAERTELDWVLVPGVHGVVSLEHEGATVRGLGCEVVGVGGSLSARGATVIELGALGWHGRDDGALGWISDLISEAGSTLLPSEAVAAGLPAPRVVRPEERPGALYRQHWGASDLLHQRMIATSQLVGRLKRELENPDGMGVDPLTVVQAQRYLWRAQAGDVFVDGEEGGIRSAGQRHRAWRDLLRADRLALEGLRASRRPGATPVDLDGDGVDEILLRSADASVRVVPARRGALASFSLTDAALQLGGIPKRTRAEWEASLRPDPTDAPTPGATGEYAVQKILQDAKRARTLYDLLREDVDTRVSFEERFLHGEANLHRFQNAGIEPTATGLDAPWTVESTERVGASARCKLTAQGIYHDGDQSWPVIVSKRYSLRGTSLELRYEAQNHGHGVLRTRVLFPLDISLGPDASELQLVCQGVEHPASEMGDHAEMETVIVRGAAGEVAVTADHRVRLWHYPIHAVHRVRGEVVSTPQGVCLGLVWMLQLWARETSGITIKISFQGT